MKWFGLALVMAGVVLACSESTKPGTGTLAIVVTTAGFDSDSDGYTVRIDDSTAVNVDPQDSVVQQEMAVGEHLVALEGYAPNCIAGSNPRSVHVAPDTVMTARFDVTCAATRAGIRIRFVPTGATRDTNGHVVLLDGAPLAVLAFNADTSIRVAPGIHQLKVTDVASFCVPPADSLRTDTLVVGDVWTVAWSLHCMVPLSGRVAYESQSVIYTIRTDGTDARQWVGQSCYCTGPSISRDGIRFAWWATLIVGGDGLRQGIVWSYVDSSTGSKRLPASEDALDAAPAWSPDGRRLAYIAGFGPLEIVMVNADGSERHQITHDSTSITAVTWSPDGGKLAYSGKGDPRSFPYQIWVINPDGTGKVALTSDGEHHVEPAWSPDGSRLAYAALRTSTGNYEIWIINADGTGAHPITTIGGRQPAWSPDGSRIAFTSPRDSLWEIYVVNADGTGLSKLTTNTHPGTSDRSPFWSP